MDNQQTSSATAGEGAVVPALTALPGRAPVLFTRELFRDTNTVQIEHDGQCYLLRLTRGNKLILTK